MATSKVTIAIDEVNPKTPGGLRIVFSKNAGNKTSTALTSLDPKDYITREQFEQNIPVPFDPIAIPVVVGTQLVDYGDGFAYRVDMTAQPYTAKHLTTWAEAKFSSTVFDQKEFVSIRTTNDVLGDAESIDFYLSNIDDTGLTTIEYLIIIKP